MTTQHTRTAGKTIAVAISLTALLPALVGCSALTQALADKWAVTYKIELTGQDTSSLESFEFLGKAESDSEPTVTKSTAKGAPSLEAAGGVWTTDTIVETTKEASVTAKPQAGTTATCRILLDGKDELLSVTGKPGESVTCSAKTPKFSDK